MASHHVPPPINHLVRRGDIYIYIYIYIYFIIKVQAYLYIYTI